MPRSHMNVSDERSIPPRLKVSTRFLVAFGMMASVLASTSLIPTAKATSSQLAFDWQKITPSPNLNWVECYGSRECARLEVPLDYSDPTGEKAAVALLRVKAKVSPHSKEYRGPILFNPGGPGGSGVLLVFGGGLRYQQIVGEEYDIVGFDPRGIGETTPKVSAFSDAAEIAAWEAGTPPLLNSTPDALSRSFSRAQLVSELVEARSKRAAQHVSTAVVARDMLSITKAHGRDRLQYWGFSYGTVLGATYAAMFPDNVGRLILDGVVDFDDYYSGSWSKNLFDTDKGLQILFDKCAQAGPACPLQANSSALVQQRVEDIFASIEASPLPVIHGTDYGLIDFSILKQGLFMSLYQPFSLFPKLAHAFAAIEKGDGIPFLNIWRRIQPSPKCDPSPPVWRIGKDAGTAVFCGEAEGAANTIPDILQHYGNQRRLSIFADIWTDTTRTSCAGWKVRVKERFAGPFAANTSFPLLIIGNTADPVTPLVGAQKAARAFHGSALLTVNSPGHTSDAATSACAREAIRNYFARGQLPAAGTVCETEDVLFSDPQKPSAAPYRFIAQHADSPIEVARSFAHSYYYYYAPRGWHFM